jgi:hypothetical protein
VRSLVELCFDDDADPDDPVVQVAARGTLAL